MFCAMNWNNGSWHGLRECFNENGTLGTRGIWKYSNQHGLHEHFDEEGNLYLSEYWENGKEIVSKRSWVRDRMTDTSATVKAGDIIKRKNGLYYKKYAKIPFTGTKKEFYKNGKLWKKGNYKKGRPHGPWKFFYPFGQLGQKITYKNGKEEGPQEDFYSPGGELMFKSSNKNGKSYGPYEVFFRNGALKSKGFYKKGKIYGRNSGW